MAGLSTEIRTFAFTSTSQTPENRQFFVNFKERLKERFQQIDIRMTTYPIEVV